MWSSRDDIPARYKIEMAAAAAIAALRRRILGLAEDGLSETCAFSTRVDFAGVASATGGSGVATLSVSHFASLGSVASAVVEAVWEVSLSSFSLPLVLVSMAVSMVVSIAMSMVLSTVSMASMTMVSMTMVPVGVMVVLSSGLYP